MMPLSLHHLSVISAHPTELITAAAAGGFDYCGIRLVSPDPTGHVFDLITDRSAATETRKRMSDTGIEMLDAEAIWLRPNTMVSQLEGAMATARELGAKYFLVVGADSARGRLSERLNQIAHLAAAAEITIALEAITYSVIPDLIVARDLVAGLDSANIVLLPDSLQFFRSGLHVEDLAALPEGSIHYAQISDAPLQAPATLGALQHEAREAREVPGEGELPLRHFINALPVNAPLAVEAPSRRLRGLPFNETARILGAATRRLLLSADSDFEQC